MKKALLLGNEAIALGAVRAGVSVVTGYPGTPSTEILETLAKQQNEALHVEWSVNEKSALELAAGAAFAGGRAMVTMKQVGLNVASDPLMSLNYVGIEGGLVAVVADDPGPISSQTEQDTRHFGKYAKIAVFDPASPEEAYTMVAEAFDHSEKYHRPVILRPTTRICHSYASVELLDPLPPRQARGFHKDGGRWVIFPALSYRNHQQIERDLIGMGEDFASCRGNRLSGSGTRGIATGGVSYAYVREALAELGLPPEDGAGEGTPVPAVPGQVPEENSGGKNAAGGYKLLKLATVPLPRRLVLDFLRGLEEVLVVEELDPVIEGELIYLAGLYHLPVTIRGKGSGDMPQAGENTLSHITGKLRAFLGGPGKAAPGRDSASPGPDDSAGIAPAPSMAAPGRVPGAPEESAAPPVPVPPAGEGPVPALPVRPPVLCAGCPHRASFFAVKEAVRLNGKGRKAVFSGDIGCYTLGNALPLDMVDTCLCMGAGITVAQGINRIEPDTLNFAFIGDSTFFHTGIPGLINAVYNGSSVIIGILDNHTTAMTGNQSHPGTGKNARGGESPRISLYGVVRSLGVREIRRVNPFDFKAARGAAAELLDREGVRVILFEGPCIMVQRGKKPLSIAADRCTGCKGCVTKLGCPAISLAPEDGGSPGSGASPGTLSGKGAPRERRKIRPLIDPVLCTGCGLCGEVCPAGAIGRGEAGV
jgi:indolepyruvate ferredoxin oxidoreductase alpha subunit